MGDGSLSTRHSLPVCQVRFLLEQVDGAIAWLNGEGLIQDCNHQLEQLLGQSRTELLGRSLVSVLPLSQHGQPLDPTHHPVQRALDELAALPANTCHINASWHTAPSMEQYDWLPTATANPVTLTLHWSGHFDHPSPSSATNRTDRLPTTVLVVIRPVPPATNTAIATAAGMTAAADVLPSSALLSHANAAIAQFELNPDLSQRCTYISDGCVAIFGYSPADMMAGGWYSGMFPPDRQIIWDAAQRRILSSALPRLSFHLEYRFQHQDGSVRWISNHLTAVRMGSPQVEATAPSPTMGDRWQVVCVAIDITHLKHIQEALYQSANRSRLAIDLAQVGSWEWDLANDALYWNEHHLRLFNLSAIDPDPTVETWRNLLHPDDLPRVETAIQTAISTHTDYEIDYRIIDDDQTVRWIMEKGRAIYDEFGAPQQMGGIVMDITERKQAQCDIEALNRQLEVRVQQRTEELEVAQVHLRQREQEFRTLVEHSPDLIWRFDTQLRYIYINPTAQQQGITNADLLGKSIQESGLPPEQLRQWQAVIQQVLATGQEQIWEFSWPVADGALYYQTRIVPERNHADQIMSVLAVARDITALKQAETQLRQMNETLATTNLELVQATRMKDEFLTNMSHELRTPLNSILGLSEALQDGSYGELTRSQHYYLSMIYKSGSHLLEIINDILDLTQITTGTLELECSAVSVTTLCETSLNAVKAQADRKRIQLDYQPLAMGEVMLDQRRMEQVLVNLLNNAVKFTPDGGRVTLRTTAVATDTVADQRLESGQASNQAMQQLILQVEDTGIGIAPADIDRLFQPFVQLDGGLSRRYEGTGLGLMLVKQIVEMHGGTVSVSSQLGQGSCFQITIPWRVPPNSGSLSSLHSSVPTAVDPSAVHHAASTASLPASVGSHQPPSGSRVLPSPTAGTSLSSDKGAIAPPDLIASPLLLLVGATASHRETWTNYLRSNGFQVVVAATVTDAAAMQPQMPSPPTLILLNLDPTVATVAVSEVSEAESEQWCREQIQQIRAVPDWHNLPLVGIAAQEQGLEQAAVAAGATVVLHKPIRLKNLVIRLREMLG